MSKRATQNTELEYRLFGSLRRIADYVDADKLRKGRARDFGLTPDEAIEMAYDNVLWEARNAIRGVRIKKPADGVPAP